jgi:hypothetical protein
LSPTDPGETAIELDAMRAYYGRLTFPGEGRIPDSVRLYITSLLAKPENEIDSD